MYSWNEVNEKRDGLRGLGREQKTKYLEIKSEEV